MKLTGANLSARGAPRPDAAGADDDEPLSAEGLAETLSRIVVDPAHTQALHLVFGPLCHQSRNILNGLKLSLYLARRQEPTEGTEAGHWERLESDYRILENLYDRLQLIWRPMTPALVSISLSLLLEDRRAAWGADFAAHQRVLHMNAAGSADTGEYDPLLLGLALDAFVAWRAAAMAEDREAHLRWGLLDGRLYLEWLESRAGPPERAETPCQARARGRSTTPAGAARERGVKQASLRVSPSESDSRPACPAVPESPALALPLLCRVISAHGGLVERLEPAGCHLRLTWPEAQVARGSH